MIGVEGEDSCGKSESGETPKERRGGSPAARGKRSLPRKSKAVFRGGIKAKAIKPPDKIETPSFSHYNETIKQDV
ncbi:hypothetical protein AAEO50_09925 [Rossellomorea oryzaecorticis]|uniref:Uncharacterized protein n=1 Tax=Rossellomorea oryzaecorticis TaxID=1396505 RepID=A0ABU9K931_9BACI